MMIPRSITSRVTLADLRAEKVHHPYDYNNSPNCGASLVVLRGIDHLRQIIADAAAAHVADDGANAHVNIPVVKRVRQKVWDDLRDDAIQHHLQAVGAAGGQGLDRPAIDILDRL